MASPNAVNVTDSNFEQEVIQSPIPVLVDFWAPWCGPCKMIAPVIDEIANERVGATKVVKVNVDESQAVSVKYGIQSIPTLMLFKGGELKETLQARSKRDLIAKLDALA